MMDKKGIGALTGITITTWLWGIVLFFVVLLVFGILLSATVRQYQQNLVGQAKDLSINTSVYAFLRSPVLYQGEEIVMAEAFARAHATEDFEPLHPPIQQFLSTLPKPVSHSGWRYRLELLPEERKIDEVVPFDIIGWFENRPISVIVPAYNSQQQLKVTFVLECESVRCQ